MLIIQQHQAALIVPLDALHVQAHLIVSHANQDITSTTTRASHAMKTAKLALHKAQKAAPHVK